MVSLLVPAGSPLVTYPLYCRIKFSKKKRNNHSAAIQNRKLQFLEKRILFLIMTATLGFFTL